MFNKKRLIVFVMSLAVLFQVGLMSEAALASGETRLDRTDWTAAASNNDSHAGTALDDNQSTRWHGSYQEVGKWFELDMQENQEFNLITLWNVETPADLPRGFEIYVAADGESPEYGEAIYTGGFPQDHPGGIGEIYLPSLQNARWIKIVLTAEDSTKYFAIHEIYVGIRD